MKQNNPEYLRHAIRKRSRCTGSKNRARKRHECPICGRMHWSVTDNCYQCKWKKQKGGNYEIVFNTDIEKEIYENTTARIRHEEQILRSKGYNPCSVGSRTADRILRRN